MTGKLTCAVILTAGVFLLWRSTAFAEPMKCGGEQQACLTGCTRLTDPKLLKTCINVCAQRQAACRQTGCWDNGTSTYCGLMRQ